MQPKEKSFKGLNMLKATEKRDTTSAFYCQQKSNELEIILVFDNIFTDTDRKKCFSYLFLFLSVAFFKHQLNFECIKGFVKFILFINLHALEHLSKVLIFFSHLKINQIHKSFPFLYYYFFYYFHKIMCSKRKEYICISNPANILP